jgi:hypothetical protein
MTRFTLAAALALGLTALPALAEDAKAYALDTQGTTTKLKPGAAGQFRLAIKPAAGHYVSPDAPFKITLAGEAVSVDKATVARADLDDPKAKAPSLKVGLKGAQAGEGKVTADVQFFLCNESVCERKTEKVTVAVSVKP